MRWLVAAALLPATAAAQPAPQLADVDQLDRAATFRAYAAFRESCPGLMPLAPLIERIIVRDEAMVLNEEAKQRGWPLSVSVEVKFREAATSMAWDLGIILMNDYTFLVGAGQQPGILAMSSDGLRLCVPHYPSDFMALPALRLPVEWPSDVADRKAHPHRKLNSSTAPLGGEDTPISPAH